MALMRAVPIEVMAVVTVVWTGPPAPNTNDTAEMIQVAGFYREKLLAGLTSTQRCSASWPSHRKLIEAQRHQGPPRSSAVSTFSVSFEGGKRRQREPVRSTNGTRNGEIASRCRHRFDSICARAGLVDPSQTSVRRRQRLWRKLTKLCPGPTRPSRSSRFKLRHERANHR